MTTADGSAGFLVVLTSLCIRALVQPMIACCMRQEAFHYGMLCLQEVAKPCGAQTAQIDFCSMQLLGLMVLGFVSVLP